MRKAIVMMAMLLTTMVAAAKDVKTVVLTTQPQMHCENCENKIKGNLRFETGVKNITTSVPDQTVTVEYDADKTTEANLIAAFTKFGFTATKVNKTTTDKKDKTNCESKGKCNGKGKCKKDKKTTCDGTTGASACGAANGEGCKEKANAEGGCCKKKTATEGSCGGCKNKTATEGGCGGCKKNAEGAEKTCCKKKAATTDNAGGSSSACGACKNK